MAADLPQYDALRIRSFRSGKSIPDNVKAVYNDLMKTSNVLKSAFSSQYDALQFLSDHTHGQRIVSHCNMYQRVYDRVNGFVNPLRYLPSCLGCGPLLAALYVSTMEVDVIIEDQNEGFVAEYLNQVHTQPLHGLIRQLHGSDKSFEFRNGVDTAFDFHLRGLCDFVMNSG